MNRDLSNTEIDFIINALKSGSKIPQQFKDLLFPTENKEYILNYSGKLRKEDILSNLDGSFPCPLQIDEVFLNEEEIKNDWKNLLVFGDNLQLLKTIYENKDPLIKNKIKSKVKLIYIDPPFATEKDFSGTKGQKAYTDKIKDVEFVDFLRKRLILAKEILAPDGTICVHLDNRKSHYIKVICDEIFSNYDFRQITWVCGLMGSGNYFPKAHEVILCYKPFGSEINPQNRLGYSKTILKSLKKDENGWYYSRGRESSGGMKSLKTYICRDPEKNKEEAIDWAMQNKKQPVWDVWIGNKDVADVFNDFSVGTYNKDKNSVDYPTQKPDELLKRFILTFTNEDDIVFDFFGGSGTTAAVSEKLNRKWVTCDIGKLSYYTIQKRLLTIQNSVSLNNNNKNYDKKYKSFITAQLGVYDLNKTFNMEWDLYKDFLSNLFDFQLNKHRINGISFDGKKEGSPVLIFDFKKLKNSVIDLDYLEDLHGNIKDKTNGKVYIVSPINYVDFMSDYYEIEDVRYYFLKVPYHIIKELHKTPFKRSKQPQNKNNVNDLYYSLGFHFILPPDIKTSWNWDNEKIKIVIKYFKTKEETDINGFETLSSIFIFKKCNGIYILTKAIFKEEFKNEDYSFFIPLEDFNDEIKVVYRDLFGNESIEIKKIGDI